MKGTPASAEADPRPRRAEAPERYGRAAALVAFIAFLPFLRGFLSGGALYFRDLSLLFHPFRRFAVEGLRQGEVRFWDPYVHEGVPLLYLPIAYPPDLLQALWVDERWFSLLLALHVPLGALTFMALARGCGLAPLAAATGSLVYALGGFTLSTVNLYVYVQAAAWAPLAVLTLRRAAAPAGHGRDTVLAAAVTAILLSTTGVEVAVQAIALGLVLAATRRRIESVIRPLAAVALGAGLAAPQLLVMRAQMAAGERAQGFAVDVVLNQSVHPFGTLQIVIANLFGDLGALPERWWGSNFFDRGFPYVLSLYLGAAVVALAATGAVSSWPRTRRIAVVALLALFVTFGRSVGLASLLEWIPAPWRVFRYPVKLFFAVHLAAALLCAHGLEALLRDTSAWRRLGWLAGALGSPLVLIPLLPALMPAPSAWFVAHFFPPALSWATRLGYFAEMLGDAARGGLVALLAVPVAVLAVRGRLMMRTSAWLVSALAAADLLRAGGGLNPMVGVSFFRVSPEVVSTLRAQPGLQRVFTCEVEGARAYWEARRQWPQRHELLTFAAQTDTLTPHRNRRVSIPSGLSPDLTALVPRSRLLPEGVGCATPAALVPALRAAGVSHVLSLDPMNDPAFVPVAEVTPARVAPLRVHLYSVRDPVPLRFVATRVRRGPQPPDSGPSPAEVWIENAPTEVEGARGAVRSVFESAQRVELEVATSMPTAVVVLDGAFPGWRAAVDGRSAGVLAAGHHRAVWVPAGTSHVTMEYRPRGLAFGLVVSALSVGAAVAVWRRPGITARADAGAPMDQGGGSSG